MSKLTHKEAAAHIRKRMKHIAKSRVIMSEYCGKRIINIITPTFDSRFTSEQIREFCQMAKDLGLTGAQSSEIHPDQESALTGKIQWVFEFHG